MSLEVLPYAISYAHISYFYLIRSSLASMSRYHFKISWF